MTEFLEIAKREGLQVVTGLSMLVGQAVRAEEIWFDKMIESALGEEILKILEERF